MDLFGPTGPYADLIAFLETGGGVLVIIMAAVFVMWAFMLERFAFWLFAYGGLERRALELWARVPNKESRPAHWTRNRIISEIRLKADQNVEFIKTMVAIAPLLGLMGTVTGMVEVFAIMTVAENASARTMSAGVSKATIPTMAGMVAAITGLFFSNLIEQRAKRAVNKLADQLEIT